MHVCSCGVGALCVARRRQGLELTVGKSGLPTDTKTSKAGAEIGLAVPRAASCRQVARDATVI